MKILDQNDQPINDPASLPPIDIATGEEELTTTHGKNGVPELPAIDTTSADDVSDADDKRICPRDQMVARLRNVRDRMVAYGEQTRDRAALTVSLLAVAQRLDEAIIVACTLPPDWKPVRATSTAALAEGVHVFIRSKHRALYQADLSADDMDDMVVLRVGEKRLRCHCITSGASIFIPAGHVEVR